MAKSNEPCKPARRTAQRDSLDFRDLIYRAALVQLEPQLLPVKEYMRIGYQGDEGSCTGFGLAAVVDYLIRLRGIDNGDRVSARMLYEMAKHHDIWPGTEQEGSSARGAMKGWHKNGVCPEEFWEYEDGVPGTFTPEAQIEALNYPLGAYYRVFPRRSDLHAALNEVQVVFATADTHDGWIDPQDGVISYEEGDCGGGGHAFAIVGYTDEGFIIQNSWGSGWGGVTVGDVECPGCALWKYADFDLNLWDAWVARLARPVESVEALSGRARYTERPSGTEAVQWAPPRVEIGRHYIHIDDGQFDPHGDYPTTEEDVKLTLSEAVRGDADHILLYAHGGLNSVKSCAARVAKWRPVFRRNRIHEIHFIWETGLWAELRDILLGKEEFVSRRAGGLSDWVDKWFERGTQKLGHSLWAEMQSDAEMAFELPEQKKEDKSDLKVAPESPKAAGTEALTMLLEELRSQRQRGKVPSVHLVGHSAGSIWFAHLLKRWGLLGGEPIESLILFAPACTVKLFEDNIKTLIGSDGLVRKFTHFLLSEQGELDDNVAQIYRKSLLYLVSRSYERKGKAVPILGMEKYFSNGCLEGIEDYVDWYTPETPPAAGGEKKTASTSHGGFDNDLATMNSMLAVVLGAAPSEGFTEADLTGY